MGSQRRLCQSIHHRLQLLVAAAQESDCTYCYRLWQSLEAAAAGIDHRVCVEAWIGQNCNEGPAKNGVVGAHMPS